MITDTAKHRLYITWAKAFGEIYCHHAYLFIPFVPESLFDFPNLAKICVTVRYNTIKDRKIISSSCYDVQQLLPCLQVKDGLRVDINSAKLIDAMCLNSWTTLRDGSRGSQKEFPTRILYSFDDKDPVELPFAHDATPFLMFEKRFADLSDGDKFDTTICFDL